MRIDIFWTLIAGLAMAYFLGSAMLLAPTLKWSTVVWQTGLALLAAYFAADLMSGIFHWLGDTFASPSTPIIGEKFVKPFRDHHDDPLEITQHGFLLTNANNAAVLVLIFLPGMYVYDKFVEASFFSNIAVFFFMAMIFITNQIHKYAHLPTVPRWVSFLQRYRIILHPEHHAIHHTPPYDSNFCITNGSLDIVMNFLLHKMRK